MIKAIQTYNDFQSEVDRKICNLLTNEIGKNLPEAENKIWHAHPVWFLDGNPIVGFSKLKNCIRLLFWSGQSFNEEALQNEGSFQAAEVRYTSANQINLTDLKRWLQKSKDIQWDYKNIIKRKGKLEPLKGIILNRKSEKAIPASSKKYKSIDDYHETFPEAIQITLKQLRQAIKDVTPQAKEIISYNMPAFKLQGVLVYYAVNKTHIGFYPTSSPILFFKEDLLKYKTSKGAIQFPINKPLPITLIKKIVKFRVAEDFEKSQTKKNKQRIERKKNH